MASKGHNLGSLFSSFLRLEKPFTHSTLETVPLNDVWKNGIQWSFTCSLEVKLLKTGVFQLKDLPDKAKNILR